MNQPRYTTDDDNCVLFQGGWIECFSNKGNTAERTLTERIGAMLNEHGDMLDAIVEFLAATDYSANNPDDDINAMMRYGKADEAIRALIGPIAEREAKP